MADIKSPQQIASGETNGEEQHFRFFDLPRELRDWCYDYMIGSKVYLRTFRPIDGFDEHPTCEELDGTRLPSNDDSDDTFVEDCYGIKIAISAPPLVDVLCASRQVKSEYEQRIVKKTTLVFSNPGFEDNFIDLEPKWVDVSHFEWVTRAEYLGVIQCMEQYRDPYWMASRTMSWIQAATGKLNNLSVMHVFLALRCEQAGQSKWPDMPHCPILQDSLQKITQVEGVTQLQLFRGEQGLMEMQEVPNQDKLHASWTEQDGWSAAPELAVVAPSAEG